MIAAHPAIGAILNQYDISCARCSIGTCLLKDVVAVHVLGAEIEAEIETAINAYLKSA